MRCGSGLTRSTEPTLLVGRSVGIAGHGQVERMFSIRESIPSLSERPASPNSLTRDRFVRLSATLGREAS